MIKIVMILTSAGFLSCRSISPTLTTSRHGLMTKKRVVFPRPIGDISVTPNSSRYRCRAEIGYTLGSDYWNKGIATYAVKLVANAIFWEWPHLERVDALVDVENVASQRVLEKAGFEREAVLKKYYILKGKTWAWSCIVFFPIMSLKLR